MVYSLTIGEVFLLKLMMIILLMTELFDIFVSEFILPCS
jgi:hypothetical protein